MVSLGDPGEKGADAAAEPASPTHQLCTHIQFKQPNFAVFYSSSCNVTRATDKELVQAGQDEESLSVREAVKLAKGQNMLGLVLDCRILVRVVRRYRHRPS